ncbi:hypothetical protein Tco_0755090 [Tanacetum coccineum]
MEQNSSTTPFENSMKMSEFLTKHLWLALLNRTTLSKDETKLLLADPTGSPSSMLNDQDAPSTSVSSTQEPVKSPSISTIVVEMNQSTHFDDPCHENLYDVSTSPGVNVQLQHALFESTPIQNSLHRDSSSQESSSNVQSFQTPGGILDKWTKNHPLSNVIGNLSQSVSTRKQL